MSSMESVLLLLFQFELFYFFSSVISVARTSKTMLNKSDKHGPSCLVPDLILEKVLSAF